MVPCRQARQAGEPGRARGIGCDVLPSTNPISQFSVTERTAICPPPKPDLAHAPSRHDSSARSPRSYSSITDLHMGCYLTAGSASNASLLPFLPPFTFPCTTTAWLPLSRPQWPGPARGSMCQLITSDWMASVRSPARDLGLSSVSARCGHVRLVPSPLKEHCPQKIQSQPTWMEGDTVPLISCLFVASASPVPPVP